MKQFYRTNFGPSENIDNIILRDEKKKENIEIMKVELGKQVMDKKNKREKFMMLEKMQDEKVVEESNKILK